MRDYKFRGQSINGDWHYGLLSISQGKSGQPPAGYYISNSAGMPWAYHVRPETLGQYTGHNLEYAELYEYDIVRLEENAKGVDPEDKITYYIVTWIKEWCMFSLLRIENEYFEYKHGDVRNLDTLMFWTFPLDIGDADSSKHYLCGNIFDNPELIQLK